MKSKTKFLRILTNVQILSAFIWATTIIACSWVTDKSAIPSILTCAAGFHVVLMAQEQVRKGRLK